MALGVRAADERSGRADGAPKASPSAPVSAKSELRACHSARSVLEFRPTIQLSGSFMKSLRPPPCPSHTYNPVSDSSEVACPNCGFSLSMGPSINNTSPNLLNSESISACLINARSLKKHHVDVADLICDNFLDILFITETWLDASSNPTVTLATPAGYKFYRIDRPAGRGGGVAIIYRDHWTFSSEIITPWGDCEALEFSIKLSNHFTLGWSLLYRPPGPASSFLESCGEALSERVLRFSKFLLLGDVNLHLDLPALPDSAAFLDVLHLVQLSQWVNHPTHQGGHILDPVCSNFPIVIKEPQQVSWTDHFPIFFSWSISGPSRLVSQHPLPICRKIDPAQFSHTLAASRPVLQGDLDENLASFSSWISNSVSLLSAPIQSKMQREAPSKPWYTPELKIMKHACKVLERAWRSSGFLATAKTALRAQQKEYYAAIAAAKSQHFASRIDRASNNAKEIFSIVQGFMSPHAQAYTAPVSDSWCDTLVNFFQNKIMQIQATFSTHSGLVTPAVVEPMIACPVHSFATFRSVDLDSSLKLIKSLKSGSPSDSCAARLLSDVAEIINPEVNCLINLSLQEAYVPESWKQAHILPLLKKPALDPLTPANYRPISLLPSLSKICEKTVTSQLTNYVEDSGLLHVAQSGFRATYSTETALLEVAESIREHLDAGGRAALVLLDLSAAFDIVPHSLLLARLADIGVSGSVLLWIKSFLAGRTQSLASSLYLSCSAHHNWRATGVIP